MPTVVHYVRTLCDKYFQVVMALIISLTNAVNLTTIGLIVS